MDNEVQKVKKSFFSGDNKDSIDSWHKKDRSAALSKIEEIIKQLKQLKDVKNTIKRDIIKHRDAMEELAFQLDEINEDVICLRSRIYIFFAKWLEKKVMMNGS